MLLHPCGMMPSFPKQPERQGPTPSLTPRAEAEAASRRAREAEALRENLRRRKLQQRARESAAPTDHAPAAKDEPCP